MRVDEKIPRDEYFADSRFAAKKATTNGSYEKTRGDNQCPRNDFERHEQFALVSRHFYYFGASAIQIPERFKNLVKRGPGFRSHFEQSDIRRFLEWLEKNCNRGKQGDPCYQELPKGTKRIGSFC
jgi:hypothetical protein